LWAAGGVRVAAAGDLHAFLLNYPSLLYLLCGALQQRRFIYAGAFSAVASLRGDMRTGQRKAGRTAGAHASERTEQLARCALSSEGRSAGCSSFSMARAVYFCITLPPPVRIYLLPRAYVSSLRNVSRRGAFVHAAIFLSERGLCCAALCLLLPNMPLATFVFLCTPILRRACAAAICAVRACMGASTAWRRVPVCVLPARACRIQHKFLRAKGANLLPYTAAKRRAFCNAAASPSMA